MGTMFPGRSSYTIGYGDLAVRHYDELCLGAISIIGFESCSLLSYTQFLSLEFTWYMSTMILGPCILI